MNLSSDNNITTDHLKPQQLSNSNEDVNNLDHLTPQSLSNGPQNASISESLPSTSAQSLTPSPAVLSNSASTVEDMIGIDKMVDGNDTDIFNQIENDLSEANEMIDRKPWTEAENEKLLEVVNLHQEKNWKKIAEYFPTRTHIQCVQQWKHVVNPRIGRGSWTSKEDAKLIQLVNKYGKKWSLIAEYLPRREGKRCRERYMNHLNPQLKNIPWTLEEEKVLTSAYNELGNQWAEIQKRLPRRSIADVQNHHSILVRRQVAIQLGKEKDLHKHSTKGTINRWTEEEQTLLKKLVEQYGPKKWLFIASHIEGKSDLQCMQHWRNVVNPKVVKGKGSWTEYEDRMLLERVSVLGPKWSKIAEFMPGRISKQCRERFVNHLDPTLKRTPWTEEEDQIMIDLQQKNWNKWALIARSLPGRSANDVKNRWYSVGQKKMNGGTLPNISQKSFTSLATELLAAAADTPVPVVSVGDENMVDASNCAATAII